MPNLFETAYNPDVLSCLANLSNDEVFTPPEVANQMLDLLPEEIWHDPNATILDPFCKSGVFLREAAKRFIDGLEDEFPDLQERLEHIFKNQLYGIAITELTSLLSRRSLYCSKYPNYVYSVIRFDNAEGNIRFRNTQHVWSGGRCKFCGISSKNILAGVERGDSLEAHAYEFIHLDDIEEAFDMKFDVIVGNPPYQLNDGGGTGSSAVPIYQKFVEQAKKLNPRYLTMIIPSRWFAGGRGLDDFREAMLTDTRISHLVDYFNSEECFPGVDLSGGVCYFLWERDYSGECDITSSINGTITSAKRPLLESGASTFIRFNQAVSIMKKVQSFGEESFQKLVSHNDPFGYDIRVKDSYKRVRPDIKDASFDGALRIHYYNKGKKQGYIAPDSVRKGSELVNQTKLFLSKSYGERGDFPYLVLGKPFIGLPGDVCTETYVVISSFDSEQCASNITSYMSTKFFRFLVMLKKNTQMATRAVYEFVPMQDFNKEWSDEELYVKYDLSVEEIDFIESIIRPFGNDDNA